MFITVSNPYNTLSAQSTESPSLLSRCAEVLTLFRLQAVLQWCYQISHCYIMSVLFIFLFHIPIIMHIKPMRHCCVKCWPTLKWFQQCCGISRWADDGPELNANLFQGWNLCKIEANNTGKINIDLWSFILILSPLPLRCRSFMELIDLSCCTSHQPHTET